MIVEKTFLCMVMSGAALSIFTMVRTTAMWPCENRDENSDVMDFLFEQKDFVEVGDYLPALEPNFADPKEKKRWPVSANLTAGKFSGNTSPDSTRCGDSQVSANPLELPPAVDNDNTRPSWCLDVQVKRKQFYLGMIIHCRIYADDKQKLSHRDLVHWLTYHRYAGVERVYLFDTYINESEKLLNDPHIRAAIKSGFVVYTDFHEKAKEERAKEGRRKKGNTHLVKVQSSSFAAGGNMAVNETRWCGFTDVDEYPFIVKDTQPGFLARFLHAKEQREQRKAECKKTTHYQMPNHLVEGGREDARKGPLLIQQIPRLHKETSNGLVKQIVRMDAARNHGVHSSSLNFGQQIKLQKTEIIMKHFWGGRKLGWRRVDELSEEERQNLYNKTVENDMDIIPEQVLRCFTSS